MPVNIPSDYFPREIALDILTACDTCQPIKLHYPHPKNNIYIYMYIITTVIRKLINFKDRMEDIPQQYRINPILGGDLDMILFT